MKNLDILHEENAEKLKRKNYGKLLLRNIIIWIAEIIFLITLCIALGTFMGTIIFTATIFTILPTPFLKTPSKYKITTKGIIYNDKIFIIHEIYKIKVNVKKMYISICHPIRGELIRLYTENPEKTFQALHKAKHRKT